MFCFACQQELRHAVRRPSDSVATFGQTAPVDAATVSRDIQLDHLIVLPLQQHPNFVLLARRATGLATEARRTRFFAQSNGQGDLFPGGRGVHHNLLCCAHAYPSCHDRYVYIYIYTYIFISPIACLDFPVLDSKAMARAMAFVWRPYVMPSTPSPR